ncbi:pilus assembly protein [Frankia sp. CNm7]|uniref:Pilus assembly protein TadE n=1 Tax=Frankia nepalensis TaxID=1836974 RepID=A0A937RNW4_9ACTN|nr:TadE family type IV pilus minor pilin [Frankia nepalensis]MBL7496251.1 pilus assembly protein [Frankia nepalensis]MBL7516398.1 pilus assembly protein [Frankia nepalensis]MBL7519772.1 pilus assembly protein [Frankia nepalensis]MBL7632239.1 hypothetical protein [Frankia nepalensis]
MNRSRRARLAAPTRPRRPDRGQATAELALGLPTLAVLVVLACWLLAAAGAQARAAEAARIGARAAARGDGDTRVAAWVLRTAPAGATVTIARQDDQVTVTVRYRLPAADLPFTPLDLTATAIAPAEPPLVGGGADDGGPAGENSATEDSATPDSGAGDSSAGDSADDLGGASDDRSRGDGGQGGDG